MKYNSMSADSIIDFGMFKGQSILEIWRGSHAKDSDLIIRNYFVERFARNKKYKVPCSGTNLLNCPELDFLNSHNIIFQINVEKNYIIITSETNKDDFPKIMKVIKSILNGSYADMTKTICYTAAAKVEELSFSENSLEFISLNGNPKYVKWCIETIDSFFIFPEDLEKLKTTEVKYFKTFELVELNYDLLKYQPVFETYISPISTSTEKINLRKYRTYSFVNSNRHNNYDHTDSGISTDWSHYNDTLDMDQQSPEFWNQF